MKVFDKKWVRFFLSLGLTITLFFILLFTVAVKLDNAYTILGMLMLFGQFLYFLAFDSLGDRKSKKAALLRYVLVILGTIINLFALFMILIVIVAQKEFNNPWVEAFSTMWFLYAVINFICYFIIMKNDEKDWHPILNCFVVLAAFIVSYFLSVILLYLGKAVHSFFNFYFGLILSILLIIPIIIIIKKERGIMFYGTKIRRFNNYYDKIQAEEDTEKAKQCQKEVNTNLSISCSYDDAVDELEFAFGRAVKNVENEWLNSTHYYGVVDSFRYEIFKQKTFKTLEAEIWFDFRASSDVPNVEKSALEKESKEVRSQMQKDLENAFKEEFQDLSDEIVSLCKGWKTKISINSKVI